MLSTEHDAWSVVNTKLMAKSAGSGLRSYGFRFLQSDISELCVLGQVTSLSSEDDNSVHFGGQMWE